MNAIVQERFGPPDVLRLVDTDPPEVGADDVLVRVHAAAINPADWHILRGDPLVARLMGIGLTKPKTPVAGSDAAGVVETVGANVKGLRSGDEVLGFFRGAFAELACAAVNKVVPKPASLTFEQAAGLAPSRSRSRRRWARRSRACAARASRGTRAARSSSPSRETSQLVDDLPEGEHDHHCEHDDADHQPSLNAATVLGHQPVVVERAAVGDRRVERLRRRDPVGVTPHGYPHFALTTLQRRRGAAPPYAAAHPVEREGIGIRCAARGHASSIGCHPGRTPIGTRSHRPFEPTDQIASSSSRSSAIGHAPSEVFEITVEVIPDAGSCAVRNETPASDPSSITTSLDAWIQKPRP